MFTKPALALGLIAGLAACGTGVRDRSLAGLDLADMALVQELGQGLNPEDRALFSTYVVMHAPSSPGFCGDRLVDAAGREPATVGEAIAFTRIREAELRERQGAEARPRTAAELAREQRALLIAQRETLIGRRTLLQAEHGAAAEQLPEWRTIAREMAAYEARLAAL